MSKSRALAGLRVGYALGDAGLIEALHRVKDSFNSYPLGRPAQAGAIASVEDEGYFQATLARVLELREKLTEGLVRLGFSVPHPRPISSSLAMRRAAARSWRRRSARRRCWFAISPSRGYRNTCG